MGCTSSGTLNTRVDLVVLYDYAYTLVLKSVNRVAIAKTASNHGGLGDMGGIPSRSTH